MKEKGKTGRLHQPVIVKILAGLFIACVICIAGYIIYMQMNYYRIEDHTALETGNNQEQILKPGDRKSVV